MFLHFIACLSSVGVYLAGAQTNLACPATVFLPHYGKFTIDCLFPPNFESVFWYKIPDQGPFISYHHGLKSGPGWESGEFDITSDGSLVIFNVTLNLDARLRVFVHYQQWENDVRQNLDLVVYEKAIQNFPDINVCNKKRYCHTSLRENELLTCYVNETRPAANLSWHERYPNTDFDLPSEDSLKNIGHTMSSIVSTRIAMISGQLLKVLVCQSSNDAPILLQNYSMILIEKKLKNYQSELPISRLSKVNKVMRFGFDDEDVYAAVWKRGLPNGVYETIGYFFYGVSESQNNVFEINKRGHLRIKRFQIENEGEYLVLYATPTLNTFKRFEVHAYIAPTPPFPKIFGCVDKSSCTINVGTDGRLTCSIQGIRPLVHLEWIFVGKDISPIVFSSPLSSVVNRGVVYDSSVTTSFSIEPETHQSHIELACRVANQIEELTTMRSNVTLHYASKPDNTNASDRCDELHRRGGIFLKVGVALISLFATVCYCSVSCANSKN